MGPPRCALGRGRFPTPLLGPPRIIDHEIRLDAVQVAALIADPLGTSTPRRIVFLPPVRRPVTITTAPLWRLTRSSYFLDLRSRQTALRHTSLALRESYMGPRRPGTTHRITRHFKIRPRLSSAPSHITGPPGSRDLTAHASGPTVVEGHNRQPASKAQLLSR